MKIRANGAPKKANPQPNLKTQPKRALFKKQQSLAVINIRESGYKIQRSKSNRTEHSLQTKQPIKITKQLSNSTNKNSIQNDKQVSQLISRSPPSHIAPYTFTNQKQYNTAVSETRKHHHTFTTLKEQPSHQKDAQQHTSTQKWTTNSNKDQPVQQQQHSQVECLKVIWHNVKLLKTNPIFRPEVYELQKNIERILLKIAEDEHCLTTDRLNTRRKDIKTTNESNNLNIHRARIEELLNNNQGKSLSRSIHESLIQEKKLAYMIDEQQVESYKGSFDSLRIENEESHKYEFLNLYDLPSSQRSQTNLKDITNSYLISVQSSDRNCVKQRESSVRLSERSQEERLDLRSIIKQAKRSRVDEQLDKQEQQKLILQPIQVSNACCDKITKKHQKVGNMDILTYSCNFLDCDFSKKDPPSSSGSSQSKRQVLNQIISMLNQKYQKTIKIDFNKSSP